MQHEAPIVLGDLPAPPILSKQDVHKLDESIAKRLQFLWEQAIAHFESHPTTSRILTRQLIRTSGLTLTPLNSDVDNLLCGKCGNILIPGKTARIRVHHRTRRGGANRRRNRGKTRHHSGILKNEVCVTCLACFALKRIDGAIMPSSSKSILPERRRPPPPPPRASSSSLAVARPPAAVKEEDFIPLTSGRGRGREQTRDPFPPRLLLDSKKPKKRKRPAQEEVKESRSLGQLKGFISSLKFNRK